MIRNIVIGIVIGLANESWVAVIIVPFIWGFVYLAYLSIVHVEEKDRFVKFHTEINSLNYKGVPFGVMYYVLRYSRATIISLLFALLTYLIKSLF